MRFTMSFSLLLIPFLLAACAPAAPETPTWDDYNPFVTPGALTAVPLSALLPPTRGAGTPIVSPTPDAPHFAPSAQSATTEYVVQAGDTLAEIALRFGVSTEWMQQTNQLTNPEQLFAGQVLTIPAPKSGSGFKIVPDSELVYGPASAVFDLNAFVENEAGYLASYQEEVRGDQLSGAQIVGLVSRTYSVNPRLLLALLEYQSGWVTQDTVAEVDFPLGYRDSWHAGLYRQLTWTANELNRGYYLWRVYAVSSWTLADDSLVPIDPSINAGTAGVQNLFAQLDDRPAWEEDVSPDGLFGTYAKLFGYSFDYAVEPLLPPGLTQPTMSLPFAVGETWSFTSGPHGGWDIGSAWAALDFGPPGEPQGCAPSDAWTLAAAGGVVVRSDHGAVILDLDGDGYEQTGWTILYMHIASRDRVQAGTLLQAGDRIGHPSCEGGIANATHLHLARRYNGEWIPADGALPFILDGWTSSGTGVEYDGYLTRGDDQIEAWDGRNALNQITR